MPRVEYTLSFENYQEMTSSRREKKDFRFAAGTAILGLVCIAAGYLFLRLHTDGSFFPGGLLLATGLLFTFLGMILGFFARSKPSRPNTRALRREYDLYYSDQRTIEFDENGWRVFWYEGEDVRPWSCLRQVYDLETLLVLATGTTYYWLPKTALLPDGQLDRLKAMAESCFSSHQRLFEVPLIPSAWVFVAAKAFHNWRTQRLPRLLCLVASALVGYWTSDYWSGFFSGFWVFAFPLLLIACEGLFYLAKYYAEDWSQTAPNAEIMSDCLAYRTKTIRWIAEYRQVAELKEIPGAFMLYFDSKSYQLIPKRGFSPERMAQFKGLVHRGELVAASD